MDGLLFVAVIAVFAGLWWYSGVRRKKRAAALATSAVGHGWTHVAEDPTLVGRWSGPPFDKGGAHRALNVLSGDHDGWPFVAFDFQRRVDSGSSDSGSKTETWSVTAVHLPAPLPRLQVTPHADFGWIATKFGVQDIEVGDPAFDDLFRVRADDAEFAAAVLYDRMTSLLVILEKEFGRLAGWRIEGDTILSWWDGEHDAELIGRRLTQLAVVAEGIPEQVWRQYGTASR